MMYSNSQNFTPIQRGGQGWLHDSTAHSCANCKTNFTFFIRKHHCRACGKIFCDKCSDKKWAGQRVCFDCDNKKHKSLFYHQIHPDLIPEKHEINRNAHDTLIAIENHIGYKSTDTGICAGICFAGIRYIYNGQRQEFFNTIDYLCQFWSQSDRGLRWCIKDVAIRGRELQKNEHISTLINQESTRLAVSPQVYKAIRQFVNVAKLFFHDARVLYEQSNVDKVKFPDAFRFDFKNDPTNTKYPPVPGNLVSTEHFNINANNQYFYDSEKILNHGFTAEDKSMPYYYTSKSQVNFSGNHAQLSNFLSDLSIQLASQEILFSVVSNRTNGYDRNKAHAILLYYNKREVSCIDPNFLGIESREGTQEDFDKVAQQIVRAECFTKSDRKTISFSLIALVKQTWIAPYAGPDPRLNPAETSGVESLLQEVNLSLQAPPLPIVGRLSPPPSPYDINPNVFDDL